MTKPTIPPNTYTHSPSQNPNLILGSLQLLFWLTFQPTAWGNYIKQLDSSLDKNFSLIQLVRQQRWKKKQIRIFFFRFSSFYPS